MLRESDKVRQVQGEPHRRWFWDDFFDLLVWDDEGAVTGFQLKYQTSNGARMLTWQQGKRCKHHGIDEGDDDPTRFDMTRMLIRDGVFDHESVASEFHRRAEQMDAAVSVVILEHIQQFADSRADR